MEKRLYIVVPCHTGKTDAETMITIASGAAQATKLGWTSVEIDTVKGDSRIAQIRNRTASAFWHMGFSDLVMVDDDVAGQPSALIQLLLHPVEMVAGAYPMRGDSNKFPVRWLKTDQGEPIFDPDPATGLIEVESLPAGFLRITRACIEKMVAAYDSYPLDARFGLGPRPVWRLFDEPTDGEDWGEDYMFCKRWRAIGGKVWLDPYIRFKHFGAAAYEGCVREWIEWNKAGNRQGSIVRGAA